MVRNDRFFEDRVKVWSAIVVALITAIGGIVAALVGSSPSAQSSADARITVVAGQSQGIPGPADPSRATEDSNAIGAASSPPVQTPEHSPSQPSGHWIAQLASVPYSDGSGARDRQLEQIQASISQAQWLSSDAYGSLSPGFWVVYVDGPFTNGADAFNFCREHGRSDETACVGRYLSPDSADHGLQCAWSGTETPPAVCYREPSS